MDTNVTTPDLYRDKLLGLSLAMLYFYDDAGNRMPAGLIREFDFDQQGNLFLTISSLPVTIGNWESYDADLYCYRKGIPYSMQLAGTALLIAYNPLRIRFIVHHVEYYGEEEKTAGASYWGKLNVLKYILPNQQPHLAKVG